jgi:hypothetical protein
MLCRLFGWQMMYFNQPRFYDNNNSVYIKGISEKKRWGKMFEDVEISVEEEFF